MVTQDLDVVMTLLSLTQPARRDQPKILMELLCDAGRTLLYPQLFKILLHSHIPGDMCSVL